MTGYLDRSIKGQKFQKMPNNYKSLSGEIQTCVKNLKSCNFQEFKGVISELFVELDNYQR